MFLFFLTFHIFPRRPVLTCRHRRAAFPSDRHAPELLGLAAVSEGQTAPLLQVKHGEEAALLHGADEASQLG